MSGWTFRAEPKGSYGWYTLPGNGGSVRILEQRGEGTCVVGGNVHLRGSELLVQSPCAGVFEVFPGGPANMHTARDTLAAVTPVPWVDDPENPLNQADESGADSGTDSSSGDTGATDHGSTDEAGDDVLDAIDEVFDDIRVSGDFVQLPQAQPKRGVGMGTIALGAAAVVGVLMLTRKKRRRRR